MAKGVSRTDSRGVQNEKKVSQFSEEAKFYFLPKMPI